MKKIIVIAISTFLVVMFLIYSGVFRDYTNPVAVVQYYFECLKNREGFLTYQICKKEFFNEDRLGKIYKKYKMNLIDRILLKLNDLRDNSANVQAKIIYKDKKERIVNFELEKNDKIWKIRNGLK